MKRIVTCVLVLLFVVAIAGCRGGSTTTVDTNDDTAVDTGSTATVSDKKMDEGGDPNADDPVFEQMHARTESVTITPTASAEMLVVDLGDLVTLTVYSEHLKEVHVWNEDLYVDATVERGREVVLTIEANEEGFFNIVDKNQDDLILVKFVVAGQSFS
jgi:hypothetical protein